jgi:hypothetical protein
MGHTLPPSASNQLVITKFIIATNGKNHKKIPSQSTKKATIETLPTRQLRLPRGKTSIVALSELAIPRTFELAAENWL